MYLENKGVSKEIKRMKITLLLNVQNHLSQCHHSMKGSYVPSISRTMSLLQMVGRVCCPDTSSAKDKCAPFCRE
jgi:hypothetical protein